MLASEKIAVSIFLGAVISIYVFEAVLLVRLIRDRLSQHRRVYTVSQRIIQWTLHLLAIIGIFCVLYGYFIEPYWIKITYIKLNTSNLNGKLRVVQISDTHCDKKIRNEKRLPIIVNGLKPDIVVFTGDAINTPEALPSFKEMLSSIKTRLGKFAIMGNYDYWPGLDLFRDTGFELLDSNHKVIFCNDKTIYIAGISYDNMSKWKKAIAGISQDLFCIFLYHTPDLIEEVSESGIDLYLAGHTHGGQIALPFYGALVTLSDFGKKYEGGKYVVGSTTLYVNQGIGMEGGIAPRVRFWARPEITVFDIYGKTKEVQK
ncbi:MAG: metallophosphoesterase [bacterium]